jgi:putative transposase
MVTPAGRRAQVAYAIRRQLSARRACQLLGVPRSTLAYLARPRASDPPLLAEVRRLAARHPRYGYRRIWALLRRTGRRINVKRVYRLWRLGGLALPRRRPRPKRRTGSRVDPQATAPNAVWTYDFVHDWAVRGGRFKCLSVVDEYTRECLALEAAHSLPSAAVVRILGQLVVRYGAPRHLRSDNGPEFIAHRVQRWLRRAGIQTAYITPGKPWQNGVGESFHSRLRDECLDREWFHSLAEARVLLEQYRHRYNAERPHSSLGYRTPAEIRQDHGPLSPPFTPVDDGELALAVT